MQQPQRNTPITRCETAALHAVHAFRRYARIFGPGPETSGRLESIAGTLEEATAALVRAQGEYRAAVIALIPARVEVKLVDLKADDVVRSAKRSADEAGKDVSASVFRSGITPIVKPVGQSEVKALRELEGRIAAATRWPGREDVAARVQAVRTEYEAALAGRQTAMATAADRRAARDSVKEDFLDAFARVVGAVKETFPRDRARQDAFFDVVRAPASVEAGEDEPDELEAAGAE